MEQDREVRDLEQVEAWVEAAVARAGEEEAGALEVVLRQAQAVIAFAPNVVKEQPINWGPPVMNSNARSVAPP